MPPIKPDEFPDQFTEAAKKADGQVVAEGHLLVLKCVKHGVVLQPDDAAEFVYGCTEAGCGTWVRVEVTGT